MADEKIKRRLPAIEKSIVNINPETDVRVRILGTVIGKRNNTLIIDDGTGKIEISFDEEPTYISERQLVRVIIRVLPLIDGFECQGECIQVLDGFDLGLYKRVKELIKA